MTFTELCSLYEIYKKMGAAPAPSTVAQVPAPATVAQVPAPATVAQVSAPATVAQVPAPSTVAQVPAPAPVTNNDLMAVLQAMQIPAVHGEAPKPESVDDVICRIAGIETNTEKK